MGSQFYFPRAITKHKFPGPEGEHILTVIILWLKKLFDNKIKP